MGEARYAIMTVLLFGARGGLAFEQLQRTTRFRFGASPRERRDDAEERSEKLAVAVAAFSG